MTGEQAEKLYEANYMRVFSYVMTLTGDRTEAEEITQETFFRAISRNSEFRGEANEITWLCAIAKRKAPRKPYGADARGRQTGYGQGR